MLQHLPIVTLPLQTAQRWLQGGVVSIPARDIELGSGKTPAIRIYASSTPGMLGIAQVEVQAQQQEWVLKKRLFI